MYCKNVHVYRAHQFDFRFMCSHRIQKGQPKKKREDQSGQLQLYKCSKYTRIFFEAILAKFPTKRIHTKLTILYIANDQQQQQWPEQPKKRVHAKNISMFVGYAVRTPRTRRALNDYIYTYVCVR